MKCPHCGKEIKMIKEKEKRITYPPETKELKEIRRLCSRLRLLY